MLQIIYVSCNNSSGQFSFAKIIYFSNKIQDVSVSKFIELSRPNHVWQK